MGVPAQQDIVQQLYHAQLQIALLERKAPEYLAGDPQHSRYQVSTLRQTQAITTRPQPQQSQHAGMAGANTRHAGKSPEVESPNAPIPPRPLPPTTSTRCMHTPWPRPSSPPCAHQPACSTRNTSGERTAAENHGGVESGGRTCLSSSRSATAVNRATGMAATLSTTSEDAATSKALSA